MLFNSFEFVVFFAGLFSLYMILRRSFQAQNLLILLGSYVFYGAWDARFLMLIVASTVTDFLIGLSIAERHITGRLLGGCVALVLGVAGAAVSLSPADSAWIIPVSILSFLTLLTLIKAANFLPRARRRKALLCLSLTLNLGLLGLFKYFNFFANELVLLASSIGWSLDEVTTRLVLPVGISFYTFQTMSYCIDIYKGKLNATDKLVPFAGFVSFFPQLVAGPIERAKNLLPQFLSARTLSPESMRTGAWLFVWGLFKKIAIADNLAAIADPIFAAPERFGAGDLGIALLAFTFQIYCDFSGYSDMARGLARILGFEIMVNFKLPYFARTPSEFWSRWHISLSSWLRDYLYISLGGNRNGSFITYRNLSLTMLLGGLWHGANWTFVIWGAYQGLLLVGYRLLGVDDALARSSLEGTAKLARDGTLMLLMFVFVVIGWLFFRADDFAVVESFLYGALLNSSLTSEHWPEFFRLTLPLLLIQTFQYRSGEMEILSVRKSTVTASLRLFVLYSLLFLAVPGAQEFIYFDF